ncbi:MAG: CsgG/HfaB family protein [Cyclobacteriaceae bacterium]
MKKSFLQLSILVSLLFILSCTGSKQYAKKARKLEKAGLHQDAAEFYYQSLRRNTKNIDARIGLRENGGKLLEDYLVSFFKANATGDHKKAVYGYLKAKNYHEKLESYKISLDFPSHYEGLFDESKASYLNKLYEEARVLKEKDQFFQAEEKLSEVVKIDANYKEASSLLTIAKAEPLYRKGQLAVEQGEYRKAYNLFTQVVRNDANYKDVKALQETALEESVFTVGVLPFENTSSYRNMGDRVSAHIVSEVSAAKDPFIRLVDRANTDKILAEQKLALSGLVDEKTAANAGQLLGVKAVLVGKVINYSQNKGRLNSEVKMAYEPHREKRYNSETKKSYYETVYRPVRYYEYQQQNEVALSFQYQLISSETGQILTTEVIEKNYADRINYSTYKGNYNKLTPDRRLTGIGFNNIRRSFIGKFNARRQLKSPDEIANTLFQKVANSVAIGIINYEQSRAN